MSNLKDFQNKFSSLLGLSEYDLNDFIVASDHHQNCKCKKCKKWHQLINSKEVEKNE